MTVVLVAALTRNFSFFQMCIMSSRNLHDCMFRRITKAYMTFFNGNSSGRILNRFSKDIDTVDMMLPQCLFEGIVVGINVSIYILVSIYLYICLVCSGHTVSAHCGYSVEFLDVNSHVHADINFCVSAACLCKDCTSCKRI